MTVSDDVVLALIDYVRPPGRRGGVIEDYVAIAPAQQDQAVANIERMLAAEGHPTGTFVDIAQRMTIFGTQGEGEYRNISDLPEQVTLWRGARPRGMKRYSWAPEKRIAGNYAGLQHQHARDYRRRLIERGGELPPELELHVYELTVNRWQMVEARLIAWLNSPFGNKEVIFANPSALPEPILVARINENGRPVEW